MLLKAGNYFSIDTADSCKGFVYLQICVFVNLFTTMCIFVCILSCIFVVFTNKKVKKIFKK